MTNIKLDEFTKAFLICALWSSNDNADDSGGEPLEANYSIEDIAEETILKLKKDCDNFREANKELLDQVTEQFGADDEQHGHDFWLTRNGHGAGFWDRSYGELGKQLSKECRPYGSVDLYIGDDGKIYCN